MASLVVLVAVVRHGCKALVVRLRATPLAVRLRRVKATLVGRVRVHRHLRVRRASQKDQVAVVEAVQGEQESTPPWAARLVSAVRLWPHRAMVATGWKSPTTEERLSGALAALAAVTPTTDRLPTLESLRLWGAMTVAVTALTSTALMLMAVVLAGLVRRTRVLEPVAAPLAVRVAQAS